MTDAEDGEEIAQSETQRPTHALKQLASQGVACLSAGMEHRCIESAGVPVIQQGTCGDDPCGNGLLHSVLKGAL